MDKLQRLLEEIDYLINDANITDSNKEYMKNLKLVIESSVSFDNMRLTFDNNELIKNLLTEIDDLINEYEKERGNIISEIKKYKKDNGSIRIGFIDTNLELLKKLKSNFSAVSLVFINEKLNNFMKLKKDLLKHCYDVLGNYRNFIYCFHNQLVIKQNNNIGVNETIIKQVSDIISNNLEFEKISRAIKLTNQLKENEARIKTLRLMINNYELLSKRTLIDSRIFNIDSRINNLSIDYSFDIDEAERELQIYKSSIFKNLFFENKIYELTMKIREYKKRKFISDKLFLKKMDYSLLKDKIDSYLKRSGLYTDEINVLPRKDILQKELDNLVMENSSINNELKEVYQSMTNEYKVLYDNEFITMNIIVNRIYGNEDAYISFIILESLISINDIISNDLIDTLNQSTMEQYAYEFFTTQKNEVTKIKENKKKV